MTHNSCRYLMPFPVQHRISKITVWLNTRVRSAHHAREEAGRAGLDLEARRASVPNNGRGGLRKLLGIGRPDLDLELLAGIIGGLGADAQHHGLVAPV